MRNFLITIALALFMCFNTNAQCVNNVTLEWDIETPGIDSSIFLISSAWEWSGSSTGIANIFLIDIDTFTVDAFEEEFDIELLFDNNQEICYKLDFFNTDTSTVSCFTTGIRCQVLPVEWKSFSGKLDGNNVLLTFETFAEISNDYFEIQKKESEWKVIDIIAGAGDSDLINKYESKDENPQEGYNYYRIKQVDYDGQFEYSKIISVFKGSVSNIRPTLVKNVIHIEKDEIAYEIATGKQYKLIYKAEGVDVSFLSEGYYVIGQTMFLKIK